MFLEFCNCHEVDAPLKVAGMEAPAPPSFHLVCRGFPSTEQSIALLYSPSCPSGGSEIIFLVPLHPHSSASLAAMSLQKTLASPSRKVIGVEVEQLVESGEKSRERLAETLHHATAQVFSRTVLAIRNDPCVSRCC